MKCKVCGRVCDSTEWTCTIPWANVFCSFQCHDKWVSEVEDNVDVHLGAEKKGTGCDFCSKPIQPELREYRVLEWHRGLGQRNAAFCSAKCLVEYFQKRAWPRPTPTQDDDVWLLFQRSNMEGKGRTCCYVFTTKQELLDTLGKPGYGTVGGNVRYVDDVGEYNFAKEDILRLIVHGRICHVRPAGFEID